MFPTCTRRWGVEGSIKPKEGALGFHQVAEYVMAEKATMGERESIAPFQEIPPRCRNGKPLSAHVRQVGRTPGWI